MRYVPLFPSPPPHSIPEMLFFSSWCPRENICFCFSMIVFLLLFNSAETFFSPLFYFLLVLFFLVPFPSLFQPQFLLLFLLDFLGQQHHFEFSFFVIQLYEPSCCSISKQQRGVRDLKWPTFQEI